MTARSSTMPDFDIDATLELLEADAELKRFHAKEFFAPVPKQREFFKLGATKSERMLMAGNGNGKTESAAYEITCHLTGEYPPWWDGKRFNRPVTVWAAGTSATMVRDAGQTKLCGKPGNEENLGSGMIPKDAFTGRPTASRSAPEAFESFGVKYGQTGGTSRLVFKTYEQDRRHWQGADIDILWPDEEPPEDIYTEGLARLRGRGISLMTFTPLLGMSAVVCRFLEHESPDRGYVKMGIRDALWYSADERRRMIDGYPIHEREARANGDPLLGSGKVFTTPEIDLRVPAIQFDHVPIEWAKIWGVDFGIDHPFAAALCAWDRERDVFYVLHVIRMAGAIALQHAHAMREVAANAPVAWPHDGHDREKGSGEALSTVYAKHKLNMLDTHATLPEGGYSLYGSIGQMDVYMKAARFKVAETCGEFFQEYGQYHYKNGQIVKLRDDVLSATRYAWMMRRRARPIPLGSKLAPKRRTGLILPGADAEHWGY